MIARFPGEWERHKAVWLAWPYDTVSFPDRIPAVEREYVRIVGALGQSEVVKLIVRPEQRRYVEEKLASGKAIGNVELIEAEYADVWARDWGPSFITENAEPAFIKWTYNAYGNQFPELLKDNETIDRISYFNDFKRIDAGCVMEGGAIEPNGNGVFITTEETLLNPNRNPHMSRADIEQRLRDLVGAKDVIWLKQGILNDHTNGHIDEVARFVSPTKIVYAWTESGENHDRMAENLDILQRARTPDGKPFELVPLHMPSVTYDWGEQAPASYCNFYIANTLVLVPQFGQPQDVAAKAVLQEAFPDRTILGVDSTDLLYGGGGLHCITQQEPDFAAL